MAPSIEILVKRRYVGRWTFDESSRDLRARRTADGAIITLPSTLRLDWHDDALAYVNHLRASVETENGIELGRAVDEQSHTAADPYSETSVNLEWRVSFQALALFERLRDGKPPVLILRCAGEVAHTAFTGTGRSGLQLFEVPVMRTFSSIRLSYPREHWTRMLQELKVAENLVIEVPMPAGRPEPWDGVLAALLESRRCFEQGGTTGWKSAAASIRHAMEQWQAIEKEDMGPGWLPPPQKDREARTKKQRMDNLRWHLMQVAHLAAHSPADEWSRDDVLALYTMLAGLLAWRRP